MTKAPPKPRLSKLDGVSISRLAHAGLLSATLVVGVFHAPTITSAAEADLAQVHSATIHLTTLPVKPVAVVHRVKAPSVMPRFALPPIFEATVEPESEPALSAEMQRVRDWVTSSYSVSEGVIEPVLVQAEDSARKAGVDPMLLVAMMAVESSFNPRAQSRAGAQGLMQVIPRFHMDKIGEDAPRDALFDPLFNVEVGTLVLVEGLRRFGSLQAALQYYGGARNDPAKRYSKKVIALKQRIKAVARSGDA